MLSSPAQVQEFDHGVLQGCDGFSAHVRSDESAEFPERQELDE